MVTWQPWLTVQWRQDDLQQLQEVYMLFSASLVHFTGLNLAGLG